MDRRRGIDILKQEKTTIELIAEVTKDDKRKKELKERVQAYELAINEMEGKQPKVRINEFLDKNWVINVLVNDELIQNENIEFISKRPSKDVRVVELVVKEDISSKKNNKILAKIENLILSINKRFKVINREIGESINE